ncbi:hypothetical protein HKX42_08515 [Salinisphaera sp. USBA-960]|nr:hypothetical protein [Salifodinibacter halophilus]NNC26916.1 hypothetical protein [Salifodinibacter halophilus]
MTEMTPQDVSGANNAKIIYVLYLVSLFIGVTGIIGVIMAYIHKDDAPAWLQQHYQFQIRTFWIGVLYIFIGVLLSFVIIGFFVLLFWLIWLIVRCVKGLKALGDNAAPPSPTGWMF